MAIPLSAVSQAEYARAKGVSKKTVTQWKQRGLLVMTADGAVDPAASDERLSARPPRYRGGQTAGQPRADDRAESNGNGADYGLRLGDISIEQIAQATGWSHAEAIKVKETFLALLRVQEYQTKAGELLPRDKNRLFVTDILLRVRTRLLAMPAGLAAPLHALKTVAEVRSRLDDAVNDILSELSAPELIGPINWVRAHAVLEQAGEDHAY